MRVILPFKGNHGLPRAYPLHWGLGVCVWRSLQKPSLAVFTTTPQCPFCSIVTTSIWTVKLSNGGEQCHLTPLKDNHLVKCLLSDVVCIPIQSPKKHSRGTLSIALTERLEVKEWLIHLCSTALVDICNWLGGTWWKQSLCLVVVHWQVFLSPFLL